MPKHLGAFFPSALAVTLIAVSLFVFILPETERSLLKKKQELIREATSLVLSFLHSYQIQVESGTLSRQEAQERAKARVREFRYGQGGKDYFWIIGQDMRTVVHPYRPDHEGQDQSELTDVGGKRFMREAVQMALDQGEGYISYHWQWQDDPGRVEEKLAYARLFKPWGWVVGTGAYLEDVHQEIASLTRHFTYMGLGAVFLVASITGFMSWRRFQADRKQHLAEQALLDAYARHHAVLQVSPNPIILYDIEGRATYVNAAFSRVFGWSAEEVIGRRIDYVPPEHQARSQEIIREVYASQEGVASFESERGTKDGRRLEVSISAAVFRDPAGQNVGMVVCLTDISKLKQGERVLRQTQKLEALGTLAGGIAHDFNNILTAINGYTELALSRLGEQKAPSQNLHKVLEACHRAKELIRQILTFARASGDVAQPVEVRLIAMEVLRLLRATLPANLRFKASLDCPALVLADPTQIHQLLLNLCTNAAQAMEDYGGQILVSLSQVSLEAGAAGVLPPPAPGPYLELCVADGGPGIPSEIMDRLFDPFFTTKDSSRGTGLGLAVVQGIVAKYGGQIGVDSRPGQGSTFRVWLPLLTASQEAGTQLGQSAGAQAGEPGGTLH